MAQGFKETAHLKTDLKKLHANWDQIDWGKKPEEKLSCSPNNHEAFAALATGADMENIELTIRDLRSKIQELEKELQETEKKNWEEVIEDFKLEFNKKSIEGRMAFSKDVLAFFTYPFWELVKDAPNYVEIQMRHKENGEEITVTIQKNSGKTPHQLRSEFEGNFKSMKEERDLLEEEVSDLKKNNNELRNKLHEVKLEAIEGIIKMERHYRAGGRPTSDKEFNKCLQTLKDLKAEGPTLPS